MSSVTRAISQRFREILYLIVSLPVSIVLFAFVMIGFNSFTLIPLAVLVFLFMLTVMERVAKFEIARTNKILATDFTVVPEWFTHPFFSWEGVKERVTSLRSWMAIAYVFVAFGWSIFSFVLVGFAIAGLVLLLVATGVFVFSSFNRSFEIIDGGDRFAGSLQFFGSSGEIRFNYSDNFDKGYFIYNIDSWWSIALGLILIALALWIIPRNTRAMAGMVEGLLAGSFYPGIQAKIVSFQERRKVDQRTVREAIADEVARPELSELSKREREILALMAEGKSNSGIAKSLYITEGSVEKHVSNIMSKLNLQMEAENHRRVLAVLTYLGINKS
jgi:DNA-binding CsgD family transcriptional regulator